MFQIDNFSTSFGLILNSTGSLHFYDLELDAPLCLLVLVMESTFLIMCLRLVVVGFLCLVFFVVLIGGGFAGISLDIWLFWFDFSPIVWSYKDFTDVVQESLSEID